MSTIVMDMRNITVTKLNNEWATEISDLLHRHNLSLRDAEKFTNVAATRTYISDWTHGKVPQYGIAIEFLSYFPREEAIECLKAAGFHIPADWIPTPDDPQLVNDINEIILQFSESVRAMDQVNDELLEPLIEVMHSKIRDKINGI